MYFGIGGVKIRCTKIHKSDLAQELKLKRGSRAEFAWTDGLANSNVYNDKQLYLVRVRPPQARQCHE